METLQSVLIRQTSTMDDVKKVIFTSDISKPKLTAKARKKLLSLLSAEKGNISKVLHCLTQSAGLIESLTNEGPQMTSICDKMLKEIYEKSANDDEESVEDLTTIDAMLQVSPRLKLQSGASVFQYIFPMFAKGSMNAAKAVRAMKLLATSISHCKENRSLFSAKADIKNLNGIFDYITSTFDPMGQAYAAEFLWRIIMAMKDRKTNEEIERIFGSFTKPLLSITTDQFCEKTHSFLKELNIEHRNIYSIDVSNLIVGGKSVTLNHSIDIGDSKIIIWIAKGAKWNPKSENCDLINLKKEDILGLGKTEEGHWCIVLDDHFDTLSDCFIDDESKLIFFDPVEENEDSEDIFQITQGRFGTIEPNQISYPEMKKASKKTKIAQTPKPNRPKLNLPAGSITPKASKEPAHKKKEKEQPDPPQTPSVTSLQTKEISTRSNNHRMPFEDDLKYFESSSDEAPIPDAYFDSTLSSDEEPIKPKPKPKVRKFQPLKREDYIPKQSPKEKPKQVEKQKQQSPVKQKQENQEKPKRETPVSKSRRDSSPKKSIEKPNKEISLPKPDLSDSESIEDIESVTTEADSDSLPEPSVSQQIESENEDVFIPAAPEELNNDEIIEESEPEEEKTKKESPKKEKKTPPKKTPKKSPKKEEKPIIEESDSQPDKATEEPESQHDFSLTVVKPSNKIQRTYAPDRWELEAFDELKAFSNIVRAKLAERHDEVNHVIEEATSNSVGEINSFMQKCDQDLEKLRSNFIETSASIASDITSKQNMVKELGEQQREHIDQMQKDCLILQKRAEEMVKRFEQQKKQLIQNQEKHIALFREDIRTEVKTAVTKKRREYSKNKVQKLVSLLEEL